MYRNKTTTIGGHALSLTGHNSAQRQLPSLISVFFFFFIPAEVSSSTLLLFMYQQSIL